MSSKRPGANLAVAVIAALSFIVGGAVPVSAHDDPGGGQIELWDESQVLEYQYEAMVRDLPEVADKATARALIAQQQTFSELLGVIIDQGAEDLIAGAYHEGPGKTPVLMLTRRDAAVDRALANFDRRAVEVSTGWPFSFDEASNAADRVDAALRDNRGARSQGIDRWTVELIESTQEIDAVIGSSQFPTSLPPAAETRMASQAREAIAKAMERNGTKGIKVNVSVEPADHFPEPESIYGGDAIRHGSSSTSFLECTTGFRVKKGSTYAFLTAGHCNIVRGGGAQSAGEYYHHQWSGGYHDMRGKWGALARHNGYWGDWQAVQEWKSGVSISPEIYVSQWSRTRMWGGYKARNQMFEGEVVCVFGRRTNNQLCSGIKSRTAINGNNKRLISTRSKISNRGDSGAPWFRGQVAYGVHQGSSSTSSFFTPVGTPLWYHGLTFAP